MLPYKLIIAASLCNASRFIPDVIKNIQFISTYFKEIRCIFIESDSTDNTIDVLKTYKNILPIEGYSISNLTKNIPVRTGKIATARNYYLQLVEEKYQDYDLLLVLDFNETNIEPLSEKALLSNFKNMDWDMICANQKHLYYDLWALRHPIWMPWDCWEMQHLYRPFFINPEQMLNITIKSRMINIDSTLPLIQVQSAFGGAGFIKISSIKNARHTFLNKHGYEMCEWPSFCMALNEGKNKIFINPAFINQNKPNKHTLYET